MKIMKIRLAWTHSCLIAIAAITIFLLLSGCAKTISHRQLQEIQRAGMNNTLQSSTWYMGSKGGYDYFHVSFSKSPSSADIGYNGLYKVLSQHTEVADRFKLTNDQKKWSVYYSPDRPDKIFREPGPILTEPEPLTWPLRNEIQVPVQLK